MYFWIMWIGVAAAQPEVLAQRTCDEECEAVLVTTVKWAMERVKELPTTDVRRLVLEPGVQLRERQDSAERAPLVNIGTRLGLAVHDMASDRDVQICNADRQSTGCYAARGKTFIRVAGVDRLSKDEAIVRCVIVVVAGSTHNWDHGESWRVHIRRVEGEWKVVSHELRGMS